MLQAKFNTIFLVCISVLCSFFFLALFSSVRCEPDDMIIGMEFRQGSFWEVFCNRYNFYSFRPMYTLLSFFTIGYSANSILYSYSIAGFYFLLYGFFVFSIYKLTKEIFLPDTSGSINKILLVCFANMQVACIYFFTTEKIEIFGWLSASIIHLVPVVFIFFSAWLIIKKKSKKTDYALLFISAVFVSGGSQHIAPSVLASAVLMGIIYIYRNRKNLKEIKSRPEFYKTIFFLFFLALFFIIFVSNPGAELHYNTANQYVNANENEYHFNLIETIKLFFKPHKLIGLGLLFVSILVFVQKFKIKSLKKIRIEYLAVILIATKMIAVWAGMHAYHTLAVGRIWFVFDTAMYLISAVLIINYALNFRFSKTGMFITASLLTISLLVFDIRHIPALLKFSSGYDAAINSLRQKSANEIITIEKLPDPDLTNQVALGLDADNGENKLFCNFYNIKAKVSVKK